ncbi:MAG: hypothetical protein H6754_05045 [Candidatus Omnitrophica bacterium]|nr:hypothetical protein [Candidatus Omnitrophota bacterium]
MKKLFNTYIRVFMISFLAIANMPQIVAAELFVPHLPSPGTMVNLSSTYTPASLKGLTIHPDNALQFDFLIEQSQENFNDEQKKEEYTKLIKYFLASLTIADKDQWVNLSPYESGRIIENNFGKTQMGRDLLAQDYLLKQITSSLMYPESDLGKKFWNDVFERAFKEYGSSDIPVDTFNKVWIMPDEAVIYESKNTAFILKSHLKVMLEEDYLALQNHEKPVSTTTSSSTSQVIREIILPALEKEVNEGEHFAQLRQIVSAMILATWYKQAMKESLLGQVYADKAKVIGVDQNPRTNDIIYQQYLDAFKKGVYNYIKEDEDKYTHEMIPRKYFAGGFNRSIPITIINNPESLGNYASSAVRALQETKLQRVPTSLTPTRATLEDLDEYGRPIANNDSRPAPLVYDPDNWYNNIKAEESLMLAENPKNDEYTALVFAQNIYDDFRIMRQDSGNQLTERYGIIDIKTGEISYQDFKVQQENAGFIPFIITYENSKMNFTLNLNRVRYAEFYDTDFKIEALKRIQAAVGVINNVFFFQNDKNPVTTDGLLDELNELVPLTLAEKVGQAVRESFLKATQPIAIFASKWTSDFVRRVFHKEPQSQLARIQAQRDKPKSFANLDDLAKQLSDLYIGRHFLRNKDNMLPVRIDFAKRIFAWGTYINDIGGEQVLIARDKNFMMQALRDNQVKSDIASKAPHERFQSEINLSVNLNALNDVYIKTEIENLKLRQREEKKEEQLRTAASKPENDVAPQNIKESNTPWRLDDILQNEEIRVTLTLDEQNNNSEIQKIVRHISNIVYNRINQSGSIFKSFVDARIFIINNVHYEANIVKKDNIVQVVFVQPAYLNSSTSSFFDKVNNELKSALQIKGKDIPKTEGSNLHLARLDEGTPITLLTYNKDAGVVWYQAVMKYGEVTIAELKKSGRFEENYGQDTIPLADFYPPELKALPAQEQDLQRGNINKMLARLQAKKLITINSSPENVLTKPRLAVEEVFRELAKTPTIANITLEQRLQLIEHIIEQFKKGRQTDSPISLASFTDSNGLTYLEVVGAEQVTEYNPRESYGGIDLTAANLDLEIKRDGLGIALPLIQQDMKLLNRVEGFEPYIIEILPVKDLPILTEIQERINSTS